MVVSGFYITVHGDQSVGLFDRKFRIEGEFYFEDENELNVYIAGLADLHLQTFDGQVSVETFEERNQSIINMLNSE